MITGVVELLDTPRAHLKSLGYTEVNHVPEVREELEYLRRGLILECHRPHDLNGHSNFSNREPLFKPCRPPFFNTLVLREAGLIAQGPGGRYELTAIGQAVLDFIAWLGSWEPSRPVPIIMATDGGSHVSLTAREAEAQGEN